MQQDPMEEWRRLTTLYGEMGDLEIRELVDQINDLTQIAQQILRDELKKRGILEANAIESSQPLSNPSASIQYEPQYYRSEFGDTGSEDSGPHEFTWKTPLCEFDTDVEARQLAEALMRNGIDSWIRRPSSRYLDLAGYQVSVAADQLEQARAVASQPIPQDIVAELDEIKSTPPYEIPVCPKCKAEDPTLESVEPSNNWLCESCGYTWSDPIPNPTAPQTAT
jgi:rubredoxin